MVIVQEQEDGSFIVTMKGDENQELRSFAELLNIQPEDIIEAAIVGNVAMITDLVAK